MSIRHEKVGLASNVPNVQETTRALCWCTNSSI